MRDVIIVALLYFLVLSWDYQPYMDVINGTRLQYIQTVVNTAVDQAKIQGDFTDSGGTNCTNLTDIQCIQQTVANSLGYPVSSVFVSGTTSYQTKGEPISLTVSIPTHLNLFSLAPSSNVTTLRASETANSEALD